MIEAVITNVWRVLFNWKYN